jgi:ankyrin repeat protein
MHTQKPRVFIDGLKVTGALVIALGIPVLLFVGLSILPLIARGNQELYDAIDQRDLNRVILLLRQGADPNSTSRGLQFFNPRDSSRRRRFDVPPLIRAIQLDSPEIVAALLDKGADANARDSAGTPALMLAAQKGHTALVKLILGGGADIHATDRDGNTVLRSNASTAYKRSALPPEIRDLLLKAGAQE